MTNPPPSHGNGWTLKTLKELIDERDRRIEERFKRERAEQDMAVAAALAAQKEQTTSAFSASEKAIIKAETTFNQKLGELDKKLGELRDTQGTTTGERRGGRDMWVLVTSGILFLLAVAAYLGVGK